MFTKYRDHTFARTADLASGLWMILRNEYDKRKLQFDIFLTSVVSFFQLLEFGHLTLAWKSPYFLELPKSFRLRTVLCTVVMD